MVYGLVANCRIDLVYQLTMAASAGNGQPMSLPDKGVDQHCLPRAEALSLPLDPLLLQPPT